MALEEHEGPHKGASQLGQWAWALFDGARSPYNALVNIFVFSAYFSTVVIGDPVRGQAVWSYMTAIAAVIIALGAPICGAVADAGGRRKPWLIGTMIIGIPCMMGIWFATPGMTVGLGLAMAVIIVSNCSFEYSAIFSNAMLPNVAPNSKRVGFLSGLSFALGNGSGIILFLFFLLAWSWNAHPLFGLDAAKHEPERAVGVLSGLWWLVFGIPMFLFTPDSPSTARKVPEAIRHGLSSLRATLSKIGQFKNIVLFLAGRMAFNEGFIVLMLFTGVFAAGILHWTPTMLIAQGLVNSVVAALAGLFGGWLDAKIGSKKSTIAFVAGCLVFNVILVSITPTMVFFVNTGPQVSHGGLYPTLSDQVFFVAQNCVAFFVTCGLVTSRSFMAKLSPRSMLNEFFGLYALSGTATSFLGPLAIGLLTAFFHNQRAGVAVGVVFFVIGIVLILKVKEERAEVKVL